MRGQIALEFLISLLAFVLIISMLIKTMSFNQVEVERIKLKMNADRISSYCNLVYLNWKNLELNYSASLEGIEVNGNEIRLVDGDISASSKCLSPNIQAYGGFLKISGERKWF